MTGPRPGPLSGVRIIDLSAHISGPFSTVMLAEQGADVVKVEPLGIGDGMRYLAPTRRGLSAAFAAINHNKRSIALDVRSEGGKAVLADLIRSADVVVQNFRPGVIERLGFGAEQVRAINPGAIFVSINGFGTVGPYAERRAYDGVMQATVGLTQLQSEMSTGQPALVRTGICDKLTAMTVAQGVTSALFARERDPERKGQAIEVAMMDANLWFLWPDAYANNAFAGDDAPAPFDFAEHFKLRATRDGHLMVVISSQGEFEAVAGALGMPELATDPRFNNQKVRFENLIACNEAMAPGFAVMGTEEAYQKLLAADVPVAKAASPADVIADPQVAARGILAEDEHPVGGRVRRIRHPIQFEQGLGEVTPAPAIGQHTAEILAEIGYGPEKVAELLSSGVVSA